MSKYITTDKDIRQGRPCFEGTRILVADILEYIASGWSVDKLCDNFPAINKKSLIKFLNES